MIGESEEKPMAVAVFYWPGLPGHVSIAVDGGSPAGNMYLSRWPKAWDTAVMLAMEGTNNSLAADIKDEGGYPLWVRFTKLNETNVKTAIVEANKLMVYQDLLANCATHVKLCLGAGLPTGQMVASAFTSAAMNATPPGVYAFALALQKLYA
jgi:hypothetical protein